MVTRLELRDGVVFESSESTSSAESGPAAGMKLGSPEALVVGSTELRFRSEKISRLADLRLVPLGAIGGGCSGTWDAG